MSVFHCSALLKLRCKEGIRRLLDSPSLSGLLQVGRGSIRGVLKGASKVKGKAVFRTHNDMKQQISYYFFQKVAAPSRK